MDTRRSTPVVCIAGVVQGAREGTATADQSYRARISAAILARFPHATIFCPVAALQESFSGDTAQLAAEFASFRSQPVVQERSMSRLVLAVRERFRELVRQAGRADVMIAYVPAELSMGTAMEMWAAYQHDRPVITISPMNQNLAIISTSTVLVPTLEEFEALAGVGGLDGYLQV